MHILFVTDNFPPETNAPASRTHEHAREWVRAGHRVTVITCAPNFPHGKVFAGYRNRWHQVEAMDGIVVHRVWSYMAPNSGFVRRTVDFVSFMVSAIIGARRVKDSDIVIATSPQFFSGVAGWFVSRMKKRPFVFEVRDLWPEQIEAVEVIGRKARVIIRLIERLAQRLYQDCARLVTVGEGYQSQIEGKYGIPAEKFSVIPNGVLFEMFSPTGDRDRMREEHGWQGKYVVLYIGAHGLSQKLDTVLEAARVISDPNVLFVFVGDGADKERLVGLKGEWGLDNCLFLPAQKKEMVPRFYEAADVSIVALRKCELFKGNYPSKMFEALAMERPVVLSGEGRSAEILEKSNGGISVEPESPDRLADALRMVKAYPDRAREMGLAGRRFVEQRYSRRAWAMEYLRVLEQVTRNVPM